MGQLWGQGSEPVMDVKKGGRDRVWEARRGQSFDQFHSLFGLLELTVMGAKLKASYILEKILKMQVKHKGLTLGLIQKLQTGSRNRIQYGDNTSVNATH